jgi:hypothetical protein
MPERSERLHATADGQIADLTGLISTVDEATLRLPCPGRQKLGDGSVGASVRHTADNYQRIAGFIQTSQRMSGAHEPTLHGGRPRHGDEYAGGDLDLDLDRMVEELSASRDSLGKIAGLTDSELDAIPPKDSFRFCDGQRTLEQVLAGLLKHQGHQVDTLRAAIA